jgi:hypothetical protein
MKGTVMSEERKASPGGEDQVGTSRRAALGRIGRLAAVTAPAITLLLAAESKPAKAQVISMAPAP